MAKKINKTVAKKPATKSKVAPKPVRVISSPKVPPKKREPNIQNIPVRGKLSEQVRKAFADKAGPPFPKVDYSEVEKRLSPAPHGIVRARAGTGKTFTLVLGVANQFRDETYPRGSTGTLWGKVVKQLGFDPEPSPQQQEVWDFMALGERPRTVCYVAFNNSIVDEFSTKYDWLVKALDVVGVKLTFSTIHSLGLSACRPAYKLHGWKQVNQYRTSDLLSAFWEKDLREVWKEKHDSIQAIQELVGLCKLTLAGKGIHGEVPTQPEDGGFVSDEDLDALAVHYGILLNGNREEVFTAVRHILNRCRTLEPGEKPDFNDMIWLPVVNNIKVERFDHLLVDESQDLNRCQQEVVLKAGKRIILVGDERQAIYGFAGADTDSIDRMQGLLTHSSRLEKDGLHEDGGLGVQEMRLTVTRRCGKAIVERARRLVPDFEAHEGNCEGKVNRTTLEELEAPEQSYEEACKDEWEGESSWNPPRYSLGEKDMVLCRVNAPLVGLAFRMLKAGKRVNIKGRDIGTGLKAFIKKSGQKEVGEFLAWLDMFQEKEAEKIKKRRNVDNEALVTLEDKCLCLRTLCEGAFAIKDVYAAIDKLFQGKVCPQCNRSYDENARSCYACKDSRSKYAGQDGNGVALVKPSGTLLSSVHRAKGLEAKRVFILRPELMPHPKASSQWEKGQEANLEYVAITRAIEELVLVDGRSEREEVCDAEAAE